MKILIIRTLKSELLPNIINQINNNFNNPSIYILTHNHQHSLNFFKDNFKEIYVNDSDKDFSITSLKLKLIKKIINQKFDYVIIPRLFNNDIGFLNVIALSLIFLPKKIAILPYKKNIINISKTSFIIKFITIKPLSLILNFFLQISFWLVLIFNILKKK